MDNKQLSRQNPQKIYQLGCPGRASLQDKDIKSETICSAYKYYQTSRGEAVGGVVGRCQSLCDPHMALNHGVRCSGDLRFPANTAQAIKQVGTNKAGANVFMRGYH